MAQFFNQSWYHQRFDGAPLLMLFVALGELRYERRKGRSLTASGRVAFFKQGKCDWYLPQMDLDRAVEFFLRTAKKDKLISEKIMQKWQLDEKEFYYFCQLLNKNKLSELNDHSLIKEFKKLIEIYINRFTSSSIIDHFALGSDRIIAALIKKELAEKKLENKYIEYFSILTAPTRQSFINEAEIDLLITAYEFKKHKDISLIDAYQQKYFWIHNNYIDDHILGVDYFLREIKKLINSRQNLLLKAGRIKNIPRENRIKKQRLIKKIKLSRYLQTLLKISDDFSHWQDERKKSTFWATHYSSLFLSEFAKRTNYSLTELKYFSPAEILHIFNRPISRKIIQKRMKECVYIGLPNKDEIIVGNARVRSIRNAFAKPVKPQKLLFGLVASPGYARGRVKKCLSCNDANKVKKGEVIVAIMTRPDYIAGIKNAEAIVCEEGGLTSHAALVARELRIPCLIAVKGATTNFKNGQLVEVDANQGYIGRL